MTIKHIRKQNKKNSVKTNKLYPARHDKHDIARDIALKTQEKTKYLTIS